MTKEIVKIDEGAFPVLSGDATAIKEVMAENFEDGFDDPFVLETITVPEGKGTVWTREDGESSPVLQGIIINKLTVRGWWQNTDTIDNSPPDCSSFGGKYGVMTTGDEPKVIRCITCPKNQWGTGPKGKGKACAEKRWLFVLLRNELLPSILSVPPSSLKMFQKYMRLLTSKAIPYWTVVTEFGIQKEKNADGQPYSQIVFKNIGSLPEDKIAGIKAYRESFQPVIESLKEMSVTPDESE